MPSSSTKPSLTSLVAFGVLLSPILYVLSYAPVYRVMNDPDEFGLGISAYRPVEQLFDDTALRTPLLLWASSWGGVREDIEMHSLIREFQQDYREFSW